MALGFCPAAHPASFVACRCCRLSEVAPIVQTCMLGGYLGDLGLYRSRSFFCDCHWRRWWCRYSSAALLWCAGLCKCALPHESCNLQSSKHRRPFLRQPVAHPHLCQYTICNTNSIFTATTQVSVHTFEFTHNILSSRKQICNIKGVLDFAISLSINEWVLPANIARPAASSSATAIHPILASPVFPLRPLFQVAHFLFIH